MNSVKQVISIGVDGAISGLQHKQKQGMDLRQFGAAEIVRASEVVWNTDTQRWRVQFLEGAGAFDGRLLTVEVAAEALGVWWFHHPGMNAVSMDTGKHWMSRSLEFQEYEEAVRVEIATLDGLRLQGKL